MKWIYFIILQVMLILLVVAVTYKHADKVTVVKLPPKALAQWYKPDNKRHVWLHNMFKLRREMQAVEFYAEQKDHKRLVEWSLKLNKHYLAIGEMVANWRTKLDLVTIENIQNRAESRDYPGVLTAVNTLQKSCDGCHVDYQAITAMTYRSADFSVIDVAPSIPFNMHMQTLSKQVNQIKIASEDGQSALALSSLFELKKAMNKLGQVCSNCHKQEKQTYPNEKMQKIMLSLEQNLKTGQVKQQARDLGSLAVTACATCHGTHRLAEGVKRLLAKEHTFAELLKH